MWVKESVYTDNELFYKVKSLLTINDITNRSKRNQETPYGFLVDYIKDNYPVTLHQCDRVAEQLLKHFEFKI